MKYKFDRTSKEIVEVTPETKPELHYIQEDTIEPLMSHATDEGKIFDSRTKLYQHYKDNGFEVTGGDHNVGRHMGRNKKQFESEEVRTQKAEWGMLKVDPDIKADAAEALRKVKWGMAPLTEREKERCLREERKYKQLLRNQSR